MTSGQGNAARSDTLCQRREHLQRRRTGIAQVEPDAPDTGAVQRLKLLPGHRRIDDRNAARVVAKAL